MSDVLSNDELKVFTDAFFVFDEDKSGSITRDEVETAFEKMDISKDFSEVGFRKVLTILRQWFHLFEISYFKNPTFSFHDSTGSGWRWLG